MRWLIRVIFIAVMLGFGVYGIVTGLFLLGFFGHVIPIRK